MRATHWLIAAVVCAGAAFPWWRSRGLEVDGLPDEVYRAAPDLSIERYIGEHRIDPNVNAKELRVLLLPESSIDLLAYDPPARRLARRGYRVLVLGSGSRTGLNDMSVEPMIRRVLDATTTGRLALAGHSRGAEAAIEFAALHPSRVAGLILFSTVYPRRTGLPAATFPVTKIRATRDGVAPIDEARANQGYLPPSTRFVTIEGGNHAQFAYCRYQLFDGEATISREEQQQQLTGAMLAALEEIEKQPQ